MEKIVNYDEMIKKADEIAASETLTDENMDELAKVLSENAASSASVQDLHDAAKAAEEFDGEGFTEKAIAVVDSTTGNVKSVEDPDEFNFLNMSLDDVLNDPTIVAQEIDPKQAVITKESVMSSLDMFTSDPEKLPLSMSDIDTLIAAVNRYKMGEKFAYFNAMPKPIQNLITGMAGAGTLSEMGNLSKHALNSAVEQFLESCVRESVMNQQIMDLNNSIAKAKSEVYTAAAEGNSNMSIKIRNYFEKQVAGTAAQMREHGDVDKAAELEEYVEAYKQSYLLTDFKAAYDANKIKIKKIEIEKFKRTCEDFNLKYSKSKNSIHEISMLRAVLDRHAAKHFDIKVIETFIVAFIKYTMNMKPSVMKEHIFMYYFVTNILSFDYYDKNNEEDTKFHNDLMDTINNFLEDIREKISAKEA